MDDSCLRPEAVFDTRACGPIHAPYASVRGSKPDEVGGCWREGRGDEVGCTAICANHRERNATNEEGVGDGIDLERCVVGDEEKSVGISMQGAMLV